MTRGEMGISDDIKPRRNNRNLSGLTQEAKPASSSDEHDKTENDKESSEALKIIEGKEEIKNNNDEEKSGVSAPEKKAKKNEFFDDMPVSKPPKKHLFLKTFVWLIVIIGLILVAIYKSPYNPLKNNDKKDTSSTTETSNESSYEGETITQDQSTATTDSTSNTANPATSQPQPAASTETATVSKSDGTIKVLNGSGVSGAASKTKAALTADGFSVLATGNAKNFSYQTTIIYFQKNKQAFAELVKTSLSSRVTSLEQSDAITGRYTVVVVIGKQ